MSAKKTERSEKETTSSIHSVESSLAIRAEKIAACNCNRIISISSRMARAADKALALLLLDKGPRSMDISTVHTCQDTENECETETEQCGVDNTHKCNRVVETEKWLSEDLHRQRCEVKARIEAKVCCKILTALGRREWKTWNGVPLELRKDIERIHRNLGHASADQLEKLFRDANVSDDAFRLLNIFGAMLVIV